MTVVDGQFIRTLNSLNVTYTRPNARTNARTLAHMYACTQNDSGRYVLEIEDGKVHKESKIGAKLSEVTTARVILGILIMLICLPIMTPALESNMNERFAVEALNRTVTVSQSNATVQRAAE